MTQPRNLNESYESLRINHRSPNSVEPLDVIEFQKMERKRLKRQGLSHLYNADYQPARYDLACEYRNARSYKMKVGEGHYRDLETFENTNQLKRFGVGPYLYVEFMRRIVWLFFFLSLIEGIRIYIFSTSNGLGSYSVSFSTFLISTTLGNYNGPVMTPYDAYIVTIIPAVTIAAMLIFFFIWQKHYDSTIEEEEENNLVIKPQKFCVQIEGINEQIVEEEDLERFFSVFGPIYEVSLVRRHKNKLSYFEELEELDEQIKQEELQIILGSGDQQHLKGLKKERDELNKYINTLTIQPKLLSAYIHFQYEKSKVDMLTYYNDHYLFNTGTHALMRNLCCCCLDNPNSLQHYKGELLYIKTDKVPEPDDINWESRQINGISKCCRILLGMVIVIIFIAISCTVIGLCSIYVSSNSINCEGVVIPNTPREAAAANQTEFQKKCYCNSNLFNSFQNPSIVEYCGELLTKLYTEQGIQWAVVATSGITNFLFGMIVHWMVNLARPQSHSSGLLVKTVVYTTFMVFNTVILPLLIYADIFGFKAATYVSLLTLVSSDARQFFNVESISFQIDFNPIWYRNVSPVFTNYILADIIVTWFFFVFYKCISSKDGLQEDQGRILQKHMNLSITAWRFNVYVEFSYFLLILVMGTVYSAGIPALIPLTFVALLSKYIMARSLLQNNSTRIEGLGQTYNRFSIALLPILLFCTALIGEWMLTGNSSIYPHALQMSIDLGLNFDILTRQLYLPFYIILAAIIAGYYLFYNTIVRFCLFLASLCYNKKAVVHPYHTRPFSEYAKTMNMVHSYNIRKNDKFKMAIINMEKHLTAPKG